MRALAPLIREFKIAMYRWALRDMDLMHKDLPHVVRRLHQLRSERPPVVVRQRSPCSEIPGMCARDPNCRKTNCPGRNWGLYQQDGGHTFSNGVVFPIEKERTGATA